MSGSTVEPSASATNVNDLPEWARNELSSVRQEAATRRVELRAKEADATAALNRVTELTTANADLEAQLVASSAELLRLRIALESGVPGDKAADFAARLKGSTEDELRVDAESAKSLFGASTFSAPAIDPSQGRGNETPVAITPQAAFAEMIRAQFESLHR
ncbi:hypothetical protein JOD54_002175 [Actinokineospora baliensis]|uniref:hypothetical protein n=1 Tax=Actinokineospora baliensis TaxID=547056 RepID=UPI00195724B0|nr:hypothetical protein [Actinokineospora baliensis]MBM7771971.1 hypothetical protein [Actinokineospora baliensis]